MIPLPRVVMTYAGTDRRGLPKRAIFYLAALHFVKNERSNVLP
jgi:hypothetical protein